MFKKLVLLWLFATLSFQASLAQEIESASERQQELLERYEVLMARKSAIITNSAHLSMNASSDESVCPYPYGEFSAAVSMVASSIPESSPRVRSGLEVQACALAEGAYLRGFDEGSTLNDNSAASVEELEYCEANLDQAMMYWNQSRDRTVNVRSCIEEARSMSYYSALQDNLSAKLSECIQLAR